LTELRSNRQRNHWNNAVGDASAIM
jgi:hypothetical protein